MVNCFLLSRALLKLPPVQSLVAQRPPVQLLPVRLLPVQRLPEDFRVRQRQQRHMSGSLRNLERN